MRLVLVYPGARLVNPWVNLFRICRLQLEHCVTLGAAEGGAGDDRDEDDEDQGHGHHHEGHAPHPVPGHQHNYPRV